MKIAASSTRPMAGTADWFRVDWVVMVFMAAPCDSGFGSSGAVFAAAMESS
jgi:hypothetical protein